jgi:hypothetical protein
MVGAVKKAAQGICAIGGHFKPCKYAYFLLREGHKKTAT